MQTVKNFEIQNQGLEDAKHIRRIPGLNPEEVPLEIDIAIRASRPASTPPSTVMSTSSGSPPPPPHCLRGGALVRHNLVPQAGRGLVGHASPGVGEEWRWRRGRGGVKEARWRRGRNSAVAAWRKGGGGTVVHRGGVVAPCRTEAAGLIREDGGVFFRCEPLGSS